MIGKAAITARANDERLPAQTIERDYVLSQLCAEIGALGEARLVFKGGTLLRLCYFAEYRYSADLDFSAVGGLSSKEALAALAEAAEACRRRVELPTLEISKLDGGTAWVSFIGPLGARPRTIKLDISDDELVETHRPLPLHRRWPDLPEEASIEGYALDEVAAEKLRCIAERQQCRDLFDIHELLDRELVDPLEAWHLYLRKAENDLARGRQRASPRQWSATFARRLESYRKLWDEELADYLTGEVPRFNDIERRARRRLAPLLAAAQTHSENAGASQAIPGRRGDGRAPVG
ncbi:MAG: nucleotidyl transferase AbiEii/AbiGii toxin family protein [Solirubrobacteraceae bacterium]